MNAPARKYRNRILSSLNDAEMMRLTPHLSPVTLEQQETLLGNEARYGFFLEQGIASVVVTVNNGDTVEVGVIGCDGVVGLPILFGRVAPAVSRKPGFLLARNTILFHMTSRATGDFPGRARHAISKVPRLDRRDGRFGSNGKI